MPVVANQPRDPNQLTDAELRFRDAVRRILSLTPEQQAEVRRKEATEAQRPKREANEQQPEETPEGL